MCLLFSFDEFDGINCILAIVCACSASLAMQPMRCVCDYPLGIGVRGGRTSVAQPQIKLHERALCQLLSCVLAVLIVRSHSHHEFEARIATAS